MIDPIRVLQIGLGDIGLTITQIIAEREGYELVGAADIDPALVGSDLGQLASLPSGREIPIISSISEALFNTQVDVAVLTTSSGMEDITPQLLELVESGLPVVSTCEELVYPWRAHPDLSKRIDNVACERSVAVLLRV